MLALQQQQQQRSRRLSLLQGSLTVFILYFLLNWIYINVAIMFRAGVFDGISAGLEDFSAVHTSNDDSDDSFPALPPDLELESALASIISSEPSVNPHPFRYIINSPHLCSNVSDQSDQPRRGLLRRGPFLFVYIHSAPQNYVKRLLLRQTWARPSLYDLPVRLAFFMGRKQNDQLINQAVELEAAQFGDIIQSDFEDSYKNLTYKAVSALRWISTYCNNTYYVLKTDDDAFVNVRALLRYLSDIQRLRTTAEAGRPSVSTPPRRLILCRIWKKMHVLRDDPKWAVNRSDYAEDFYPPYCSGIAWVFTVDIAVALYRVSSRVKFFWVDDVYITGILPARLSKAGVNVTWSDFGHAYIRMDKMTAFDSPTWFRYVFVHLADTNYFARMWTKMEAASQQYPMPRTGGYYLNGQPPQTVP